MRREILITDLADRIIAGRERTASEPTAGRWLIGNYELETVGKGRCLGCNDSRPGQLTLRLGVEGYYRVSFVVKECGVFAKLTGEPCFRSLHTVRDEPGLYHQELWHSATELLWYEGDLNGRDLIIDDEEPCTVMAIRLTPAEPRQDPRPIRWPMATTSCISNFGARLWKRPEDILFYNHGRIRGDSCMRLLVAMGVNGDVCAYPTQVGTTFGDLGDGDWAASDRAFWSRLAENMRSAAKWGVNPIRMLAADAHRRGWRMYVYVRPTAWSEVHFGASRMHWSRFFGTHPEWRNLGREGEQVAGLSLAYPQVREHLRRIYAELSSFGIDGVSPNFVRGTPRVFYEEPVVNSFADKYGQDPRGLAADEPRWLEHVASYTTLFLREVRQAIGGDCKLSPFIFGSMTSNRLAGVDPTAWAAERLVDDLFIATDSFNADHLCHDQGDPDQIDIDTYNTMPGRENMQLWVMGSPWNNFQNDPVNYIDALKKVMNRGADGYLWWDADANRELVGNIWDLGRDPQPDYERPTPLARYQIKSWNDYAYSYYSPIDFA